jgi:hypothetical protein
LEFWSLLFVWDLRFVCDLVFSVTVADCRKREKSIEAPSEGSSKLGSLGLESFLPVLSD